MMLYEAIEKTGVQLSDLYLQYLRQDGKGRWSNRELSSRAPLFLIEQTPSI